MANILLIHGFGVSIKTPFIEKTAKSEFSIFKDELENGTASIFDWSIKNELKFYHLINPFNYIKIYLKEKQRASDKNLLLEFKNYLFNSNSEVLLIHSLGNLLLFEYLKKYNLPKSIKYIISLQADIANNFEISNEDLLLRMEKNQTKWINYYFPFDPALLISMVINSYLPLGLVAKKNNLFINKKFISFKNINIHKSALSDLDFKKELNQYLNIN